MQHVDVLYRVQGGLFAHKSRPDTPSSSADSGMVLNLNGKGLDSPPPSSTNSVKGQSKAVATSRPRAKDKHGKRKERAVHQQQIPPITTVNAARPRSYYPPSPELTSTSGYSTLRDARAQYASPSPDPTLRSARSFYSERETQVAVVIEHASSAHRTEGPSFSRGLVDRRTFGSAVMRTAGSGQVDGRKTTTVTGHRKRKEREQEPPGSAFRASGFGFMAAPKKVTTWGTHRASMISASSLQHTEPQSKRPRPNITDPRFHIQHYGEDVVRQNLNRNAARSALTSGMVIRLSHKEDPPHPISPKSPAPKSKIIKFTLKKPVPIAPAPTSATSRASTSVSGLASKHTKTIATAKASSKRSASTKQAEEAEAATRLRSKDPIKYYAKRHLDGTIIPPTPRTAKSKGKAVRKKINVAGEGSFVRSRQPSPFPAWHRTTAVLDRYGVPTVPERRVEHMPTDNCYVLIPIYEPKTKLVVPELIPDRFDIRSSQAALQVNELLRRGRPLACRWGKCDAIMACETMLDKHMHRSGHLRKALVVPPEHYEPDAWVCQWVECTGKAFALESELEQHVKAVHIASGLHCPFAGCDEVLEKMSQLLTHIRKCHSNRHLEGQIRPLIGANDNKGPPKRHGGPVPMQSLAHQSLYIPVARAVWRYEQRKRAVIDLVSDMSFIDRLDVKMQAGNLEMNINIDSDPQKDAPSDDDEEDDIVLEVEEEWLDCEPESETASDEVTFREETAVVKAPVAEAAGTSRKPSPAAANPETQMRRSTRRVEMQKKADATKAVERRDTGYSVVIPVTREWVALPDGPRSM